VAQLKLLDHDSSAVISSGATVVLQCRTKTLGGVRCYCNAPPATVGCLEPRQDRTPGPCSGRSPCDTEALRMLIDEFARQT